MIAVRQAVLSIPPLALALAACGSRQISDHVPDQTVSPNSVTFTLLVPRTRSFCEQPQCEFGGSHMLSITDTSGQPLQLSPGACPTFCSADCTQEVCPIPCPPPTGFALAGAQMTWDGSYYESSTCGSGTSCYEKRIADPGHYVATFCAMPGEISEGMYGLPTCFASGPEECVEVQFMFPSSAFVVASLPDAAP
jgi:hypothetical protein